MEGGFGRKVVCLMAATLGGLALAGGAGAQEEDRELETIVITATRTPIKLGEATGSITVIEREELEARQVQSVLEVLRSVPGVDVVQSGSRGNTTTVFLRGAESDHTLVLIDGMEVNSVTLSSFDFADLTVDNVERIEVMRGGGGTLYGSQAIGGVVNIITRRGAGAPTGAVAAAGGNGSTHRESARLGGAVGPLGFSLAGSFYDTEGFRPENDDYRNGTVSGRFDYQATSAASAAAMVRYTNSDVGLFGNNNFLGGPDPNARMDTEDLLVKGEWEQELARGLEYRISGGYARDDQRFLDPPDALESARTESDIISELVSGEAQLDHYLGEWSVSTFGLDYDLRIADVESLFADPDFGAFPSSYDRTRRNLGLFFQEQLALLGSRGRAVAGVRIDDNQDFGSAVSPAGSASFLLWRRESGTLRAKASYAEGFKAPSFNELFFPDFGNPDLDAETSREWDFGAEASFFSGRCLFEVTYFHRDTDDLIEGRADEGGRFMARNVGEVTIDGVEVSARFRPFPWATLAWNYAHLGWRAQQDLLLRRPSNRASVNLDLVRKNLFVPHSLARANLNVDAVGDRLDVDPERSFAVGTNAAYARSDLAVSYTIPWRGGGLRSVGIFARVENLFDTDYREALGFEARPLNVLAGLAAEL